MKPSEVLVFRATVEAPKTLLIVGGLTTVTLALAVLLVPPLVEVAWTLLF